MIRFLRFTTPVMLPLFAMALTLAEPVCAQQATMSPLGVLITPPKNVEVPTEIAAVLPKHSAVRLLQKTTLTSEGESVVVFDTGDDVSPDAHIAVIKDGKLSADLGLGGDAENYALFQASEFIAEQGSHAFVLAFRNIGDGSGTLYELLTKTSNGYEISWKRLTHQGRLKVLRTGKIEVWSASGEGECVWCPHPYEVTTMAWKAGGLASVGGYTTKTALDPEQISAKAIVVEQ